MNTTTKLIVLIVDCQKTVKLTFSNQIFKIMKNTENEFSKIIDIPENCKHFHTSV